MPRLLHTNREDLDQLIKIPREPEDGGHPLGLKAQQVEE